MSIKLENLFIEGASLEPTLLERLKTELSKVITLKNQDEVSIYAWWDAMNNDFIRLNQNYQDYIRDLNSIDAEEMMKTKEFLVFKDKLMEYLRTFVKSLQKNTAVIESVIEKIPREDILWILNKVVKHEIEIPRLDTIPSEVDIKDMIYGRWESIETWFVDKDGVPNEASKLFDATNEIIRKITRYATQITELYNLSANRKEEYRKLSQIFDNCTDINEAHRLSALVFGIEKPIHIKGEFFRGTDNINSGVYDEEAFLIHLTPRIRAYKERFQRNQIKEHGHEKEMMRKIVLEQLKKEQELLESYIVNYEIDFSSLPCIEPEARNVLLIWLSKGLESTKGYAKTENGKAFYVDVSHKDKLCEMKCSDGVFLMPRYKIVFDNKRAKS